MSQAMDAMLKSCAAMAETLPVAAHINGTRVPMVLDTGASSVVLTQEAAKAAGLPIEVLNYTVNIDTANGRTRAAAVTLDRLAVGGLTERSVPALVAQPGQLKNNLLGMSFLNRLESWEVRGDKLRLRGTNKQPPLDQTRGKSQRDQDQEYSEGNLQFSPRQPMRQPHAIAGGKARYGRHQHETDAAIRNQSTMAAAAPYAASRPTCSQSCLQS